jgi:hypothetical protein
MNIIKTLCNDYDKIVSALDQKPLISKSEFLEINLKKNDKSEKRRFSYMVRTIKKRIF